MLKSASRYIDWVGNYFFEICGERSISNRISDVAKLRMLLVEKVNEETLLRYDEEWIIGNGC